VTITQLKTLITRERAAGAVIAALGLFVLAEASGMRIGTPGRMGPGMMPLVVGLLLTLIGIVIAATDDRSEAFPSFRSARPAMALTSAFLAFAFLVEPLGLVIAVVAAIILARFASPSPRLVETFLYAGFLSAFAVGLFVEILGLPLKLWP
jgi:hypothetical protein